MSREVGPPWTKGEGINDFLGPFHGEGRDDDFFPISMTVGDGLGQFVQAIFFVFMSGLRRSIPGRGNRRCGQCSHLLPVTERTTDIARKYKLDGRFIFFDREFDQSRTEDMPGILKIDLQTGKGAKGSS